MKRSNLINTKAIVKTMAFVLFKLAKYVKEANTKKIA